MMEEKKNIVLESIKFGFKTLVKHIFLFVCILLAAAVMKRIISIMATFLYAWFLWLGMHNVLSLSVCGLLEALSVFCIFLGLYKIALDLCDYGKISAQPFFSCLILLPRVIAGFVFFLLAIGVGMIFLLIPGMIIAVRCVLFPYFIIDRNMTAIESLKMSYEVTKKHGWQLFLLSIIVWIIGGILDILFVCFNVVGLVSSVGEILFVLFIYAYFYRALVPRKNNVL